VQHCLVGSEMCIRDRAAAQTYPEVAEKRAVNE
jgi:hypothetical protein